MKKYVPLFEEYIVEISDVLASKAKEKADQLYGRYASRTAYPNINKGQKTQKILSYTCFDGGQVVDVYKKPYTRDGQTFVMYWFIFDGDDSLPAPICKYGVDDQSMKVATAGHLGNNPDAIKHLTDIEKRVLPVVYRDIKSNYGINETLPRFIAKYHGQPGSYDQDGSYKPSGGRSWDMINGDEFNDFFNNESWMV